MAGKNVWFLFQRVVDWEDRAPLPYLSSMSDACDFPLIIQI